jgi:outer membrane protein, heavy metal efflux system
MRIDNMLIRRKLSTARCHALLLLAAITVVMGQARAATPIDPTESIELQQAQALALRHHPALSAFDWELRARDAEALQAGIRPNPGFSAELENAAGSGDFSGVDQIETTFSVSQRFELGGKRSNRRTLAELERDLVEWDYETAKLDVLSRTQRAFVDLLAAQEQVRLTNEIERAAEEMLVTVSRRVEAGAALRLEESRAKVVLESNRVDARAAIGARESARLELASMWGSTSPHFERVAGDFFAFAEPPDVQTLLPQLERNPSIARWITELDTRRAALEVANSNRIPDLELGAGIRRLSETRDNAFVLGVQMDLPLFDRNQGRRQAAAMRVERDRTLRRAVALQAATLLLRRHNDAQQNFEELRALQDAAVPAAERAFEEAREAYALGRLSFTAVLDTRSLMFDLRRRLTDITQQYLKATADLERLIAAPLADLNSETGRP